MVVEEEAVGAEIEMALEIEVERGDHLFLLLSPNNSNINNISSINSRSLSIIHHSNTSSIHLNSTLHNSTHNHNTSSTSSTLRNTSIHLSNTSISSTHLRDRTRTRV